MTDAIQQKHWMKLWLSGGYQKEKYRNFYALDEYLSSPPKNILDIGCGLAWESRLFNKKYGTELWLLDGDSSANTHKLQKFGPQKANLGKWHDDSQSLYFYHTMQFLDRELQASGLSNYKLIDADSIDIPEHIKFDLITSWKSCGFHYPPTVYRDLIMKHSHDMTVVALDIRKQKNQNVPVISSDIEIVKIVSWGKKHVNAHVRFV